METKKLNHKWPSRGVRREIDNKRYYILTCIVCGLDKYIPAPENKCGKLFYPKNIFKKGDETFIEIPGCIKKEK